MTVVCSFSLSCKGPAADRSVGAVNPSSELDRRNEVIVLGTIHERHRASEVYGVPRLKEIIRRIQPDYVFCEIPPDRMDRALREFREKGSVSEPRVRALPEYTDVIFPLSQEMSFQMIPCSGWTRTLAKEREERLKELKAKRPEESRQMKAAMDRAETLIETQGMADDPFKIHSEPYDAIVREGVEPYNRHFNEDLGRGGWDNINAAHYALISRALDQHRHEDKRILIMFGSWHKYWFLEKLKQRDDIVLVPLSVFLQPVNADGAVADDGARDTVPESSYSPLPRTPGGSWP